MALLRNLIIITILALPTASPGQRLASVAEKRVDVDGDGRVDLIRIANPAAVEVIITGSGATSGWKPFTSAGKLLSAELGFATGKAYGGRRIIVAVANFAARADQPAASEAMVLEWQKAPSGLVELWRGAVGPQGRDREWSRRVEATALGLLRYQLRPGVSRCDGKPAFLFPEAYDFSRARFRPINNLTRVPDQSREIVATRVAPAGAAPTPPPMVFRAQAASTQAGADNAGLLSPPREIDDGNLATAWREDLGGFGKGEFVTATTTLEGASVRALRIVPGDATSARSFADNNRLKRVAVLVGDSPPIWASFAPDPARGDFAAPYWIVFDQPVVADCVSLLVTEVYGGRRGAQTAIAELAVLTDIDLAPGGPYAHLARRVIGGGRPGEAAARALSGGGRAAADAILAELARTVHAPPTTLRLRRILATLRQPVGGGELIAALADDQLAAGDRTSFVAALTSMGSAAIAPAQGLLTSARTPASQQAAIEILSAIADPGAGDVLIAAAGAGNRDRRQALAFAIGARPLGEADALIAAIATAGQSGAHGREADLIRALGRMARRGDANLRIRTASLLKQRLDSSDYELRYRLFTAAGLLADDSTVAKLGAALSTAGDSASARALRRVAITALARNPTPAARAVVLAAASDVDPGVRNRVALALGQREDSDERSDRALAKLIGNDVWPGIRRAAAGALSPRCHLPGAAAPLFVAVDDDEDVGVRRAALTALVTCRAHNIGARLVAIAGNEAAPTSLRMRAVTLIGALDDADLTDELIELLAGFRRQAWSSADSLSLAATAAATLGALGGQAVIAPLESAAGDAAFPEIQAAAVTAIGRLCPRGATGLLTRLSGGGHRAVVAAARAALAKCKKNR